MNFNLFRRNRKKIPAPPWSIQALRKISEQLRKPFEEIDLPNDREIRRVSDPVQRKSFEVIKKGFENRLPIDTMKPFLSNVIQDAKELEGPETLLLGRVPQNLISSAHRWIDEIDRICSQKSNADLELHLVTSLPTSRNDVEEHTMVGTRRANSRQVRLPVAIINKGAGPAFRVRLAITGNSVVGGKAETYLGTIRPDEIKSFVFEFHQDKPSATMNVSAIYQDFDGMEDKRELPLRWPGLTNPLQSAIHNPYIVGRPISSPSEFDTVFRGRKEHLRTLRRTISGCQDHGTFIHVRGLRRTGKTSLLLQVRHELKEMLFVYIDCLNAEMKIDMQLRNQNIEEREIIPWIMGRFLQEIAFELTPDDELTIDSDVVTESQFETLFDTLRQQGKRVILVLDEADAFARSPLNKKMVEGFGQPAKLILDFLKKLTAKGLIVVFVHELVDDFWSQNIFPHTEVRLGLLRREDTEELAKQVSPDVIYTPLALNYLWTITGGYPFLIQLVCYYLVESLNQQLTRLSTSIRPTRQWWNRFAWHARNLLGRGVGPPATDSVSGVVDIEYLKQIVEKMILSADARLQTDYLRWGFSKPESELLRLLTVPGRIDTQTGEIIPFRVESKVGPKVRLRNRDECTEDSDYDWIMKEFEKESLQVACRNLLTKEIFDRYQLDERDTSTNIRLRVGFLWLSSHESEKTK